MSREITGDTVGQVYTQSERSSLLLTVLFLALASSGTTAVPNVLFIAIDDLRPALGCYGDETAITPNIDALADRGTTFTRAYCQMAVCSPSRLSLITGRRPDTTKVWDLGTHFREALPDVVTLPEHFRNHGYRTRAIGKILHGGGKPSKDPQSWSEAPLLDTSREAKVRYATAKNLVGKGLKRAASESADVPDGTYIDGIVCDAALTALNSLNDSGPFFLAVGFRKPHLPFCAPKKYWDLYQREDIPAPVSIAHPKGAPELATRSWMELEGYTDIPRDGKLTEAKIQELRHGYYACVSYVDAMVGRLLQRLRQLDLTENTIVVLWGDHGFHLGEQGLWTKANNYELSTCVPLIVAAPDHPNPGAKTKALVELVDLYPTLADLCDLRPAPGVEGSSMKPLLQDPTRPWKTAVFSQYPRSFKSNRHRRHGDIMGYTLRTATHRYVEWREWKTRKVVARELYDHSTDPDEMINSAAKNPGLIKLLSIKMKAGWKAALPPR